MRVTLLPVGTRGDHQPFLALAHELRARGHEIELTAAASQADAVKRAGFHPHRIPFTSAELLETDAAKRALTSGKTLPFIRVMRDTVQLLEGERGEAIHHVLTAACEGAGVVVACPSTLPWAMERSEKTGQPVLGLLPFPLERTGDFASPFVVRRQPPTRLLRLATYVMFEASYGLAYRTIDQQMRHLMGLPGKPRNPFRRIREDSVPMIHLVSPVLLPKPRDWPARSHIVGAPVLPQELRAAWGEDVTDPALERWLDEGEPPVYFCMTSMPVLDPAECCALISTVSHRLGVRALVTVKDAGPLAGISTGGQMYVVNSFDYDRVLPQCRAVVHHGGSGTTHDVMRAGIPAVVLPVFGDQNYAGWRVAELGLGVTFPYSSLTVDRLHRGLLRALAPDVRRRAQKTRETVAEEDGVRFACDAIEQLARK